MTGMNSPSRGPGRSDPKRGRGDQRVRTKQSVVVADGRGSRRFSLRLVAVVIALVVAVVIVLPTVSRYYASQQELSAARAELAETQQHNDELQAELDLWNDDDYVRAQARERLGYVMPGQTLYVVKDPNAGTAEEQLEKRVATVNRDRRAATPWYVTMWDSVTVSGQTTGDFDNPNDIPVLNSPEDGQSATPSTQPSAGPGASDSGSTGETEETDN